MASPTAELAKAYDPGSVEGSVYRRWLESGCFGAPGAAGPGPRFSLVMPPPNVTGRLHMGHALDNTLQDVFVRWRRMCGDAVLWVPGTDHAGIATQAVVERRLAAEGSGRLALGREAFVARVWAWKGEYEAGIVEQLQRLGCSCDWERQRFTLDAGLSAAVEEVFVRYHHEGLLYRGNYVVNWCTSCGTAISDLEVVHEPEDSRLYRIRYPLAGGGELVVATVRPETMLGDAGVAVHPDDARYRGLVGRTALLPLVGRPLPVVADAHVDPSFGTGALKVTPAHDADDAEIAARHGLAPISVIGVDGRMTAEAGPNFSGLPAADARVAVVEALRQGGFLVGEEAYTAAVGRCSRCGSVVEPLISRQWFLRMRPFAERAAAAVRQGAVRFVPERFTQDFLQWMERTHDWCVSRQLWWGHRIPAYECAACGETTVARDAPPVCPKCGAPEPPRDADVLDTWFSSALWPFSTLGWPWGGEARGAPGGGAGLSGGGADLSAYYPTDLLVTGRDILFFWVARMVCSALHLTGEVPFRTVLLHGLVRDAQGRKMSKSRGNGIDPLETIERYGADALRLTLLVGVAPGNDSRFAPQKLEGSQRFCNKLWNAARFACGHLAADGGAGGDGAAAGPPAQALADRWILSSLAAAAGAATAALARFDAGEALAGLQAFVWEDFCDWYLEAVKSRLFGGAGPESATAARQTLHTALRGILRLLHPFLPFITEEIWSHLPAPGGLLLMQPWPTPAEWPVDPQAEATFGLVREIVGAIRSLRAEMRVAPTARVHVLVRGGGSAGALDLEEATVRELGRVASIERRGVAPGEAGVSAVVGAGVEVVLLIEGLVDVAAEWRRLAAERDSAEREWRRAGARLAHPGFRERARPEVVAQETTRHQALQATVERLTKRMEQLAPGGGAR